MKTLSNEQLERAKRLANDYDNWIGDNYDDTVNLVDDLGHFVTEVSKDDDKKLLSEKLSHIETLLKNITESGHIVFESPSPCSTEVATKKAIIAAIGNLTNAVALAKSLRY